MGLSRLPFLEAHLAAGDSLTVASLLLPGPGDQRRYLVRSAVLHRHQRQVGGGDVLALPAQRLLPGLVVPVTPAVRVKRIASSIFMSTGRTALRGISTA